MLEDKFKPYLQDQLFLEVVDLVRQNSKGRIWVVGGFVYKNLVSSLYGGKIYNDDIDFIVEEREEKLKEIHGWQIYINNYGTENYQKEKNKMSFTDIRKAIRMSSIKNPTIGEFIGGTPLNVQSIAYDLEKELIIGQKGIKALKDRTVCVNNKEEAEFYAQRKSKRLEDILLDKARELGFSVV